MKILEVRALVIISLMTLVLTVVIVPTKYHQGFNQNDIYMMSEPFSSGSLLTYSSLETFPHDF